MCPTWAGEGLHAARPLGISGRKGAVSWGSVCWWRAAPRQPCAGRAPGGPYLLFITSDSVLHTVPLGRLQAGAAADCATSLWQRGAASATSTPDQDFASQPAENVADAENQHSLTRIYRHREGEMHSRFHSLCCHGIAATSKNFSIRHAALCWHVQQLCGHQCVDYETHAGRRERAGRQGYEQALWGHARGHAWAGHSVHERAGRQRALSGIGRQPPRQRASSGATCCVLQMPRGNLEVVAPRALMGLAAIADAHPGGRLSTTAVRSWKRAALPLEPIWKFRIYVRCMAPSSLQHLQAGTVWQSLLLLPYGVNSLCYYTWHCEGSARWWHYHQHKRLKSLSCI